MVRRDVDGRQDLSTPFSKSSPVVTCPTRLHASDAFCLVRNKHGVIITAYFFPSLFHTITLSLTCFQL